MVSCLIQQVRVIDPVSQTDRVMDVALADGAIQQMSADRLDPTPTAGVDVINGQGKVLLPGLVDLYSQSGEPGNESRETLRAFLAAGQAGGFTRLGLLPTTTPPVDHPALVDELSSRRDAIAPTLPNCPQLYPWAALTQAAQGQQMTELAELAAAPIVGFTDGRPLSNLLLLKRLLEYAQPLQKPIALWARDLTLVGDGIAREGTYSMMYGLPGDPASSEASAVAAILECAAEVGTPIHLMRLSTARGVALVQQAKASGVAVTASTTWMHLLLNSQDLKTYDPNLRLAPPLGNPDDQTALVEAVRQGVVDAIAIDHKAYSYEEKTVGFPSAPPGAIGLDLALPLLWQTFVAPGRWSALELVQALSTRPAQCWQQSPPALAPWQPAEMVLFDPEASWKVDASTLKSQGRNTPWLHQTLIGKVEQSWVS